MRLVTDESESFRPFDQYATVSCYNCGESMTRSMKVIVRMLEVDKYCACSSSCRKAVEQELFEALIYFGGVIS